MARMYPYEGENQSSYREGSPWRSEMHLHEQEGWRREDSLPLLSDLAPNPVVLYVEGVICSITEWGLDDVRGTISLGRRAGWGMDDAPVLAGRCSTRLGDRRGGAA